MANPVTIEAFLSDGGGDIDKDWLGNFAQAWVDAGLNGLPSDPSLWVGALLRYADDGLGNVELSTTGDANMGGAAIDNVKASLVAATFTGGALTIDATNAASYRGRILTCSSGSAQTVNIAAAVGDGFSLIIDQNGAGQVTIASAGAPLVRRNRLGHTKTAGQYASVLAYVVGNDLRLRGDTAA